ncbi:translation initiation factor IF-2 [Bubalus bubalis]|uniref:translation initiation factor IF-2 n=1 Tax=Bubalus bubalis TaxID=89462 RepID=UPI001E1B755B|nr:translation initiation factor IF-2 [Bubalus bubalis]
MPGRQRAGPAGPSPSRGPPASARRVWLSAPIPSLRRAPSGPAPSPARPALPVPALPAPPGIPVPRALPAPSPGNGLTAGRAAPAAAVLDAARPRRPAPPPLPPGALHGLYAWLDALPLSRRKRHLARDFSDGGEGPGACPGVQTESPALVLLGQREPRGLVGGTARQRPRPGQVMLAEVVKLFRPRLVDLHNYVPTCNTGQKRSNWNVLNRKVFHKLGLSISEEEI